MVTRLNIAAWTLVEIFNAMSPFSTTVTEVDGRNANQSCEPYRNLQAKHNYSSLDNHFRKLTRSSWEWSALLEKCVCESNSGGLGGCPQPHLLVDIVMKDRICLPDGCKSLQNPKCILSHTVISIWRNLQVLRKQRPSCQRVQTVSLPMAASQCLKGQLSPCRDKATTWISASTAPCQHIPSQLTLVQVE